MSEVIPTVRLVRSGHDPVDILPAQVTPLSIARIFSVSCIEYPDQGRRKIFL